MFSLFASVSITRFKEYFQFKESILKSVYSWYHRWFLRFRVSLFWSIEASTKTQKLLSKTPWSIQYFVPLYNWYCRLTDGSYLDILINNAGLSPPPGKERAMTEYNTEWELTMAVNCIAPVLLTDLLIDSLKQTAALKVSAILVAGSCWVLPCHSLPQKYKRLNLSLLDGIYFRSLFMTQNGKHFVVVHICCCLWLKGSCI